MAASKKVKPSVERPRFFATPRHFRAWLERHHADGGELWVGFHKRGSGKPSITWPESVDEALCFGWIDGLRKSIDETSYRIRFTPRRPTSKWSTVNIRRLAELIAAGRMRPAGLAAFERRDEAKSREYSYEQRYAATFSPEQERRFRGNGKAWATFQACPSWYQRTATYWVVSAKREETRERRLTSLIERSERGEPIRELKRPSKPKSK
jgi:uncharacterized protein YdeI (YjbR/CyaY-like superfamily)